MPARGSWFAVSLAALLLAAALASAGDPPPPPPPAEVALEPARVDLGSVPTGQPARRAIAVRNGSASAVRFVGRRDGASTIGVVVVPAVIPAGGRAEATILLAPREETGAFSETLRLAFSGEQGEHVLDLLVEGEVCPYFLVEPGRLDFGVQVAGDAPRECALQIHPVQREDADIRGFELPEGMTVTSRERIMKQGRPGVRLTLSYVPAGGPGPRSGRAAILLAGPRVPRLEISWACYVRQEVDASPPAVDLGAVVRGGPSAPLHVRLSSCLGRPVSVLGLATTGTALALVGAGPPGPQVDVRLALDPSGLPSGRFAATALLAIDRPSQPTLAVEVTGEVVAPVEAAPRALVVISRPGEAGEGRVVLRAREGGPAPAYGAPALDAAGGTVTALASGRDLEVRVRVAARADSGTTVASLRVPLGIAGEADLVVPVWWIRR